MTDTDWIDRREYPFASHHFQTAAGKLHYVDEGNGEVVVMLHGNPAWSFLYRKLIKRLSPHYRCIAPDHIGFGLSDIGAICLRSMQRTGRSGGEFPQGADT